MKEITQVKKKKKDDNTLRYYYSQGPKEWTYKDKKKLQTHETTKAENFNKVLRSL